MVRVGKNLKLRFEELEAIVAKHDADQRRGADVKRPAVGKLNDLFKRFPSSAHVPPHVTVPVSKKDFARLMHLARKSGQPVESLVARWVRERLARPARESSLVEVP